MNDTTLVGVNRAMIIDKNSKILIVRNIGKKFWHYPGGKWEPRHESLIEGIEREITEEIGLVGLSFSFLAIQELHRDAKTYIETYWSAHIDDFDDIELEIQKEEIEEAKWISIEDLGSYGVLPSGLTPLLLSDSSNTTRYLGSF